MRPWEAGTTELIQRVDYEPVGMVSAAPMSGDWYHQHFGVSAGPLRLTAWMGPNNARGRKPSVPGEKRLDMGAIDVRAGGSAIAYDEEDPFVREEFARNVEKNGGKLRMGPELYDPNNEETKKWGAADF
jgi:hypothetical protein